MNYRFEKTEGYSPYSCKRNERNEKVVTQYKRAKKESLNKKLKENRNDVRDNKREFFSLLLGLLFLSLSYLTDFSLSCVFVFFFVRGVSLLFHCL